MPRLALALVVLPLWLPLWTGCGDDGAQPDAGYNCELETRDDEYTAGMEKTGAGGMTFRLVSSDPAPPSRYDNTWVIEILDDTGAPLDGATVEVTPFMPDHGHGTGIAAVVTEDPDVDGRYLVEPVNLFMPGLWEITIEATPAGGTAADRDEAVFSFCIAS
jgi:hypothetical protein